MKILIEISKFFELIRLKDYLDKIYTNTIISLIYLISLSDSRNFYLFFVIFFIYQFFLLSYGYLVNNYCDRATDEHSKIKSLYYFSSSFIIAIIFIFGIAILIIPIIFLGLKAIIYSFPLLFLGTFYSAKPIRFKERGFMGIIVASITQKPLLFLFFVLLTPLNKILVIYLFIWLFLSSVMVELTHQFIDYNGDRNLEIKTWIALRGKKIAKHLNYFLFSLLVMSFFIAFLLFNFSFSLLVICLLFIPFLQTAACLNITFKL